MARFDALKLPQRNDSDFSLFDSESDDDGPVSPSYAASPSPSPPPRPSVTPRSSLLAKPVQAEPRTSALHESDANGARKGLKLGVSKLRGADANAASFVLRTGPNYAKNGNKVPSLSSLYELVACESIACKTSKIADAPRLFGLPRPAAPVLDAARALKVPPLFVCNIQLPSRASLFGSGPPDPGTSLVFFFRLRPDTPANIPALKLLQHFVGNQLKGRFKVIGYVDNLKDLGVPSVVANFNGRPFIVEKTGVVHRRAEYVCVDVDVHQFPILARKSLVGMRGTLPRAVLRCGFVLQGESDDELPERLLGGAVVSGVNLDEVVWVPEA